MKWRPYPRYVDSGYAELGKIPEQWDSGILKRFARMNYGDALASDVREEGEVPVFGSNGPVGIHSRANTSAPAVIIGRKGSFGCVSYSERPAFCIDTAYYIDPRHTEANIRWLYYTLQAANLDDLSQDTGVPGLSRENAYARPICHPSAIEQHCIATALDREIAKLNTLIAKQEHLIELVQEKRQAVISHAVTKGLNPKATMKDTGVEWLGDIPSDWLRIQLGKLCRAISDGPHFSPSYVDDGGVMFISARNIRVDRWALEDAKFISHEDYLEFCKRIVPEAGDVLYTKGGTTGVARVVDIAFPFQVWVHVAVLKLQCDIVVPEFLAYALNGRGCYEQAQLLTRGATNQDLGLTRMIRIWLALPPIAEQQRIVEQLNRACAALDVLVVKARRSIDLMREHRSALISAAVTGKIDVRAYSDDTSTTAALAAA